MCGDQEDQPLLDIGDDLPALAQAVHQGCERFVAKHEVGRVFRDRVPLPMETATSACCRAGASLTPSPVTATVRCSLRAMSTRRNLSSGTARATTDKFGQVAP